MKKRKKQIANFLKLGAFLLGVSLLLWNCEKDNNLPQEEGTGINQTNELYQAKNWFEKNENDLLILKYTQFINWDNAILSHGIQGTIIEVPLLLNENIVTKMESNKTLLSFHRLVLKKEASNMFSIFHLQITTSNSTFNNSNKAFNYYSLQHGFDGYITLIDVNNKVASFNEFYQGKIITKPESIASREVMTCTYVGWWSNGTFEPISELWCTSEGGSNGEDDGESGYNYGGGGTTSGTTEDQIINNLTGKALCVYNKLLASGISNYHNMITDLFIEFGDNNIGGRDLTFKMSSELPDNIWGDTKKDDETGDYIIFINSNVMSRISSIEVAAVLVHEISHAFLGKHYNDSNSSFSDLYQNYINDTDIENFSHDIMKDQFINRMATVLKNYHPSLFSSFEDYKILCSRGVFELSDLQKTHLINTINKARQNDKNCP